MSATPNSTLADCEQLVADLQRQLAECSADRDEALAREAALAEVLQATNSAPGDLTPVFDAILEKAHSLCGVERGALVTYDGEYFRMAATHGMPQYWIKQFRRPYRGGSHHERLLRGERYVQTADAEPLRKPCKVVSRSGLALARSWWFRCARRAPCSGS